MAGARSHLMRHICAICGDKALSRNYGAFSCEGCKGFFKRTVRKNQTYACLYDENCMIDKQQRISCKFCRFRKCLAQGMKAEALRVKKEDGEVESTSGEEERQQVKEEEDGEMESTSGANSDMFVKQIMKAEVFAAQILGAEQAEGRRLVTTNTSLLALVEWAKRIPHFTELPLDDQILLLRSGWHELLICKISFYSTLIQEGILTITGSCVRREKAYEAGVGEIFNHIFYVLVYWMKEMEMDETQLGCLRTILLFNPDAKGLAADQKVEELRSKVYTSLEEYCETHYHDGPGQFAELLSSLRALRYIGLKYRESLLFLKLIGRPPIDTHFLKKLVDPILQS